MKVDLFRRVVSLEEKRKPKATDNDFIKKLEGYVSKIESGEHIEGLEKYESIFNEDNENVSNYSDSSMHQGYDIDKEPHKTLIAQRSQDSVIDNMSKNKTVETVKDEPPYEISESGNLFGKEWVKDSSGKWYQRTVINLENIEVLPLRYDPLLEAAIKPDF